jgi:hypothetical protein
MALVSFRSPLDTRQPVDYFYPRRCSMSASAVLKLQKAGFSLEQVEALADFMDTQAASKADLGEAKNELKADIAEVKNELKAEITEVRSELKLLEQLFRQDVYFLPGYVHNRRSTPGRSHSCRLCRSVSC